jgi:hypothetical protein
MYGGTERVGDSRLQALHPSCHAIANLNVSETGVQLNSDRDGLDPAHGLVAVAVAQVVSRGRLVVIE